jgi:hypothetical protein
MSSLPKLSKPKVNVFCLPKDTKDDVICFSFRKIDPIGINVFSFRTMPNPPRHLLFLKTQTCCLLSSLCYRFKLSSYVFSCLESQHCRLMTPSKLY